MKSKVTEELTASSICGKILLSCDCVCVSKYVVSDLEFSDRVRWKHVAQLKVEGALQYRQT